MVRKVLRKAFRLLLASAALSLLAGSAVAQVSRCAPHDNMVSTLGETFAETQHAYGLLGPRAILEVFVSEKGGWTIIVTGSDGISCILAVGLGWETLPALAGEGARAHLGE
jgi:hypothetical protein